MWQTYLGSLGLPTTIVNATEPVITPVPTNRPRCSVGPVSKSCGTVAPASCIISANKVDLFYWPAVTAAPNATGQSSNGSAIVTAVYGTHTFTSPSVYLLFDKIQAISTSDLDLTCTFSASLGGTTPSLAGGGGTSSYVGPAVSALVSLDPSSLSSLVRDLGPGVNTASAVSEIAHGGPSYSHWLNVVAGTYSLYDRPFATSVLAQKVDFANFDVPPASAYYMNINVPPGCNRQGAHPECSTIFDAAYKAQLLVPDQIRTLRPEWATCSDPLFGALDPPIALSAAGTVKGPGAGSGQTSAAEVTSVPTASPEQGPTTSAVPGSGVGTTGPAATALPQTTKPVTTTTQPVQSGGSDGTSPPDTDAGTQLGSSTVQPVQSAVPGKTGAPSSAGDGTIASNQPAPGTLQSGGGETNVAQPESAANGGTAQPSSGNLVGNIAVAPVTTANIVFGSVTLAIPVPAASVSDTDPTIAASEPSITLAGTTIAASAAQSGVVVLGGTSVSAGDAPVVIGSQTIQVVSGGLVADGTTVIIPALSASAAPSNDPPLVTLGTATLAAQAGPSGIVIIGGTTLSAGGAPVIVAGQTVNIVPSGIVADGTTISLGAALTSSATTAGSVTVVTFNSAAFTVSAPSALGAAVVNGVTVSAGAPATRINSQLVSVISGGVVVDGQSVSLAAQSTVAAVGVFTATNGQPVTALQGSVAGVVVVGGSTLSVGGAAATISGQIISAGTGGVVVDGRTVSFAAQTTPGAAAIFTATNGQSVTAAQGSIAGVVIVEGSTISAGGAAVTISGQVLSAVTGGIVVDGSTVALEATTSSVSLSAGPATRASGDSPTDATITPSGSPEPPADTSSGTRALRPVWLGCISAVIVALIETDLHSRPHDDLESSRLTMIRFRWSPDVVVVVLGVWPGRLSDSMPGKLSEFRTLSSERAVYEVMQYTWASGAIHAYAYRPTRELTAAASESERHNFSRSARSTRSKLARQERATCKARGARRDVRIPQRTLLTGQEGAHRHRFGGRGSGREVFEIDEVKHGPL
ncbi:hypothetical protein LTR95_001435 [Oleoguttula sp. CCFEE 5521]